jgi:hypothetical protein
VTLEKRNTQTSTCGINRNAKTRDAATNNDHIEFLMHKILQCLRPGQKGGAQGGGVTHG